MYLKKGISTLAFAALSLTPLLAVPGVADSTVTGNVFRDANGNGLAEAGDTDVQGVTVTLYDTLNATIGTDVTGTDGNYTISVTEDGPFRVEFTDVPAGLVSSGAGADNGSTVQFVDGDGVANLALVDPADFCNDNALLVTSCYLAGNVEGDALVSFPYSYTNNLNGFGGQPNPGMDEEGNWVSRDDTWMPTPVAMNSEIGTTYGLAYNDASDTLYSGSFVRRKAKLGGLSGESTGAIYQTAGLTTDAPTNSVFVDLNAVFGAGTAGENPHPSATTNFNRDEETVPFVGKRGLGDVEISPDNRTVYTVNLADNNLYSIPVASPTNATNIAIPSIPGCEVDTRPFALKAAPDGTLHVGAVCSAETSQDAEDLEAYVWAFDGTSFETVLTADFTDYRGGEDYQAWRPWAQEGMIDAETMTEYPQPMLVDLELAGDGDLILGFRDRYGDQTPGNDLFPNQAPYPRGYGDILRAQPDGNGGFALSDEYYPREISGGVENPERNQEGNDEVTSGALAYNSDRDEVVVTAYDPVNRDENGNVITMNYNSAGVQVYGEDGSQTGAYGVYLASYQDTMGKTNGLGDLELICEPAPIEIGNYVWLDTNANGLQDAGERGLEGVEVSLMEGTEMLATATTDASGNYIFSSRADTSTASMIYNLDLEAGADYQATIATDQTSLDGYIMTQENVEDGANGDAIDSDGMLEGGVIFASVMGVEAGANHTYDFGFTGGGFGGTEEFGSVGDLVFLDVNNDGAYNEGDEIFGGVDVELWQDLDGDCQPDMLMDVQTTDENGAYLFDQLPLNVNYVVRVNDTDTDSYINTLGTSDENNQSKDENGFCVTLTPETPDVLTADFGYYRPTASGGAGPEEPESPEPETPEEPNEPGFGGAAPEEGEEEPEVPTGGAGLIRTGGEALSAQTPYLLAALATFAVLGTYLYKSR